MISKSLHKAAYTYKSIIFLKEKDLGGVGFKKEELGTWQAFAIVPSFFIIFGQPYVVPSKISYQNYIGFCIAGFTLMLLMIPGLADLNDYLGGDEGSVVVKTIMKFNYMLMSLFTAKLFTPAMNILLNKFLDKYKRAALNSIFFLGASFLVLVMNVIGKASIKYFFDDLIQPMSKLDKYYALWLFIIGQGTALAAIFTCKIESQEARK